MLEKYITQIEKNQNNLACNSAVLKEKTDHAEILEDIKKVHNLISIDINSLKKEKAAVDEFKDSLSSKHMEKWVAYQYWKESLNCGSWTNDMLLNAIKQGSADKKGKVKPSVAHEEMIDPPIKHTYLSLTNIEEMLHDLNKKIRSKLPQRATPTFAGQSQNAFYQPVNEPMPFDEREEESNLTARPLCI